jgi:hypothetical protein
MMTAATQSREWLGARPAARMLGIDHRTFKGAAADPRYAIRSYDAPGSKGRTLYNAADVARLRAEMEAQAGCPIVTNHEAARAR